MTAEKTSYSFNRFGTTEGELTLGDVMKNDTKMAVMIRRIFPSSFKNSQYIGLHMSGKLDGSITAVAPAAYQIYCGESPVNGTAGMWYAENGDIIIGAPRGRIRMFARDIDLISTGNGTDSGWINLVSNATIEMDAAQIKQKASDDIGFQSERDVNFNVPGTFKVSSGSFKVVEGPDVSPVTSPSGSGANSPIQQLEGLKKLIESLV